MTTLLYNPGVRIVLDTRAYGIIDVTEDIESGTMTLNENALHTLSFTLSNRGGKYIGKLTPNDRVVVQMKRVQWLQVFSGYLNVVPYFSTFNQSVTISASCTLKRVFYHFWDPGLTASIELLNSALMQQSSTPDAGMTQVIIALLIQVIGWDPALIHIGVIPLDFLQTIANLWTSVEAGINTTINNLGGLIVGGQFGTDVGSTVAPNLNGASAPPGTTIPVLSGLAQTEASLSKWDASFQWGYGAPGVSADEQKTAKAYLKGADGQGQRILVGNALTGKCICVSTNGGFQDSTQPQGAVNLSASAMNALGISGDQGQVVLAWAPVKPTTPFGPFTIPPPAGAVKQTGASQSGLWTDGDGQLIVGNWAPTPQQDYVGYALTGYRALMNDTSIYSTVASCVNTALRSFCSAPNGDFIAWFPDYFGLYGLAATYTLETIELQDFTITWTDATLVTHQYTVGSTIGGVAMGTDPSEEGNTVTATNMYDTYGVATIDVPGLFAALFNTGDADNGLFGKDAAQQIYQQFGARPSFQQMQTIGQGEIEFWYAVHQWMLSWSQQFSCNIPITFTPELFPGMLLRIPAYGFQAYVTSVTHSWSLQNGGGFQTQVGILAPSSTDGNGLIGLARSYTT
jgi:hypothetical protein